MCVKELRTAVYITGFLHNRLLWTLLWIQLADFPWISQILCCFCTFYLRLNVFYSLQSTNFRYHFRYFSHTLIWMGPLHWCRHFLVRMEAFTHRLYRISWLSKAVPTSFWPLFANIVHDIGNVSVCKGLSVYAPPTNDWKG